MQEEEKKTVDIDTSGPDVDIELPEEKTEEVAEQPTEDTTNETQDLKDGGSADDTSEKPVEQSAVQEVINKKTTVNKLKSILKALKSE